MSNPVLTRAARRLTSAADVAGVSAVTSQGPTVAGLKDTHATALRKVGQAGSRGDREAHPRRQIQRSRERVGPMADGIL